MRTHRTHVAICLVTLLSVSTASAQSKDAVSAARIAQHAICRALFAADGTAQVVCYLAFVDGISESVFSGTPSEATAFFTLRTDRISAQTISNGNIVVFL